MTDELPDVSGTPAAESPEPPPPRIGEALREARTALGISLEEVSGRIKFAPRQIEALEADNFDELPETAFLRGFVRSYARLLHLDPEPLLKALPHAPDPHVPQEARALQDAPFPNIYAERRQNIIWLAAALLVAVALGFSAWLFNRPEKAEVAGAGSRAKTSTESMEMPEAVPVSALPDTGTLPEQNATAQQPQKPAAQETAPAPQAMKPPANAPVAIAPEKAPVNAPAAKAPEQAPEKAKTAAAPAAPAPRASAAPQAAAKPATPAPAAKPATGTAAAKALEKSGAAAAVASTAADAKSVKSADKTPVKPAEKPKSASAPQAPAAQGAKVSMHLTFDQDSWVEVIDKDGKHIVAQLNRAGSELAVANNNPPFTLLIGNASAVHLTYKGRAIDLASHTKTDVAHLTLE